MKNCLWPTANVRLCHSYKPLQYYGRHNITILEREYSAISLRGKLSIATADVIVDARTGIILRPVSQLEETSGLKDIVNLTYSLSAQYELLWIILYSIPTDR